MSSNELLLTKAQKSGLSFESTAAESPQNRSKSLPEVPEHLILPQLTLSDFSSYRETAAADSVDDNEVFDGEVPYVTLDDVAPYKQHDRRNSLLSCSSDAWSYTNTSVDEDCYFYFGDEERPSSECVHHDQKLQQELQRQVRGGGDVMIIRSARSTASPD